MFARIVARTLRQIKTMIVINVLALVPRWGLVDQAPTHASGHVSVGDHVVVIMGLVFQRMTRDTFLGRRVLLHSLPSQP